MQNKVLIVDLSMQFTETVTANLDCFLQDPAWQAVLTSVLDEHTVTESQFSDCGSVVILLWTDLAYVPSLWKDVQAVVCSGDFINSTHLQSLQHRLASLNDKVSQWRSVYEPLLLSVPDLTSNVVRAEKRFETLGLCLTCLIILKRLAIALDPLAVWALEVEEEVQTLGEKVIEIEACAVRANPRAALFMRFKKEVAFATLRTTKEWRVASLLDARVGANGLLATWVYERWCKMKGRKV